MRKLSDGDGRLDHQRFRMHDPDLVVAFIANVELARDRMDDDACQKDVRAFRVRLDGPLGRGFAFCVFENVHEPGSAARNKEPTAVLAEGQSIPGLRQSQELSHLPIRHVQQCHAMIAESAADGDEAAFVGRDHHFEGHVGDGHVRACGRDAPAIEQQILTRL